MTKNIMTWNTGLTEGSDPKKALAYIKGFLDEQDNTIAVLEQIPYRLPDDVEGWSKPIEHPIYTQFMKTFSDYNIFKNTEYNHGCIRMLTVIVTKMTGVLSLPLVTTNRECAVQLMNSYSLLGLHAKAGADNAEYLRNLNTYAVLADIALGDFNAGDYHMCENRELFRELLKDHVCICDLPTRVVTCNNNIVRKTCIDHVFVKNTLVDKVHSLVIHDDITISDHYTFTFCIDD